MSEFELVALGDIADIRMGQSPDSNSYTDDDRFMPFLQGCGDFTEEFPETRVFCSNPGRVAPEGSVLVSVRAPVGTTNIADQKYCIGRGLASVKSSVLPAVYLREIFNLSASFLYRRAQGSTFDAISSQDLRAFPIPVPKKKEQLEQLVDIFQSVNLEIRTTQALIGKYVVIKQGMMADLFSRGIDPTTGQLRPSVHDAPELYHETPIGLLPRDWCISKLSCIADVIDPQPDHRTPPQDEHGIPYVGISDFQDDEEIDSYNCRLVSLSVLEKQRQRFLVESGDIIFGKIGTIGQPKMIRGTGDFALSANILLIKPATGFSRFLYEFMKSDLIDIQLSKIVNITSQPAIGINTMRELTIPIPTENELQYINRSMDSIESHLWSELKMLSKLKFQKVGLMQDLLTGKVPVSA
ncbi:TPA: restriction endonuclease subunit S [Aeromonas hydrophila]